MAREGEEDRGIGHLLQQTISEFVEDDGLSMAAALAYYAVFSLPPLLVLVMIVGGTVVDEQQLQGTLQEQMQSLAGDQAASQVQTMLQRARLPETEANLATMFGIAVLVMGATGVFVQLQWTINKMWKVVPDPEQGYYDWIVKLLTKRIISFGMILAIAFLLLTALVVSAVLSAFGPQIGAYLPGNVGNWLLRSLDFLFSLGIITLLFAAIFKILPDATIRWRDVWIGAFLTALLFVLGKFVIGYYIGQSNPGSTFGAAGSLAVILIWIYYSAVILFLGAEFTQVYARSSGAPIEPEKEAVQRERE